jgi:molecular chaperone GrpE
MGEDNSKCCSPDREDIHSGCCGEDSSLSEDSHETPGPARETEGKPETTGEDAVLKLEEEISNLKESLQNKDSQIEELIGRLKRLQADFDNFKRRTQREKEEMVQTAASSVMESLLPVLDNFQRATQVNGGEEVSFREGIEMIIKQLEKSLRESGLEPIECVGSPFDPNFHEAVFMVEDDSVDENTVVEEVQKGYIFGGKVLRPAMVKVSRKST